MEAKRNGLSQAHRFELLQYELNFWRRIELPRSNQKKSIRINSWEKITSLYLSLFFWSLIFSLI